MDEDSDLDLENQAHTARGGGLPALTGSAAVSDASGLASVGPSAMEGVQQRTTFLQSSASYLPTPGSLGCGVGSTKTPRNDQTTTISGSDPRRGWGDSGLRPSEPGSDLEFLGMHHGNFAGVMPGYFAPFELSTHDQLFSTHWLLGPMEGQDAADFGVDYEQEPI